jgi:YVTN family beta-propeller protein
MMHSTGPRRLLAAGAALLLHACGFSTAAADIVKTTQLMDSWPDHTAFDPLTRTFYIGSVNSPGGNDGHLTVIEANGRMSKQPAPGGCSGIDGVAVNATTRRLYLTGCNTVSVLDAATYQVLATVPFRGQQAVVDEIANRIYVLDRVGTANTLGIIDGVTHALTVLDAGRYPDELQVNPQTGKAYVMTHGEAKLRIVDGATNTIGSITLPYAPTAMAVNRLGNTVYLGLGPALYAVDGGTQTGHTIALPPTTPPSDILVLRLRESTNQLYVGNSLSITVVDAATEMPTATLPSGASDIGFNEASNRVYLLGTVIASTFPAAGLEIFDAAFHTRLSQLTAPGSGTLQIDSVANRAYIVSGNTRQFSIVDGNLDPVAPATPLPGGSAETLDTVAINRHSNTLYAASTQSTSITVMDGYTRATRTVDVGAPSVQLAVNESSGRVYVLTRGLYGHAVKVVEPDDTISATIAVDEEVPALQINPTSNKIYVANSVGRSLTVIDDATHAVATINLGTRPESIGINRATNTIYTYNPYSRTIKIVDGASGAVTGTISGLPNGVDTWPLFGINETTNKIYLIVSGELLEIDGATQTMTTLDSGVVGAPFRDRPVVRVDETTNTVYATNRLGQITVVDGATRALSSITLPTSNSLGITDMVLDVSRRKLFVNSYGDSSVTTVDLLNGGTATVGTDVAPRGIAYSPVTGTLYAASAFNGTLSEIHDVVGEWTYSSTSYRYVYFFYADHHYAGSRTPLCANLPCGAAVTESGTYTLSDGRYLLRPAQFSVRRSFIVNGNRLIGEGFGTKLTLWRN